MIVQGRSRMAEGEFWEGCVSDWDLLGVGWRVVERRDRRL
jgi:hypothetical protein